MWLGGRGAGIGWKKGVRLLFECEGVMKGENEVSLLFLSQMSHHLWGVCPRGVVYWISMLASPIASAGISHHRYTP